MEINWISKKVPGTFFSSDSFKFLAHIVEEWAELDPGQLKYFGGKSLLTQSHG